MRYKNNLDEALARWNRFWTGEHTDRPIFCIHAPSGKTFDCPSAKSHEEFYTGIPFNLARLRAHLGSTWWGAESLPGCLFLSGWTASSYTSTPEFHERTIWFPPVHLDFSCPPPFMMDYDNPWFRRYEALHAATLEDQKGNDYFPGQICLLPGNDMLSMLMGTEAFMMALIEEPDWMRAALHQLADNWCAIVRHFYAMNRRATERWYGLGWHGIWGPKPFVGFQSDVSCMISPEMFEEFILPELDLSSKEFGPMWYHLDGPGAIRHLDALLSREYIRIIQWVPGSGAAPHGEAWMDLYRKVQNAGRALDLYVNNAQEAEYLTRRLDPALLNLRLWLPSMADGERLIADAVRWTREGAL